MESVSPNQRTGQNLCKINDFSPKALAAQAVQYTKPDYRKRQEAIDRFLTGRLTGSLVMILLLLLIFWITITGQTTRRHSSGSSFTGSRHGWPLP